MIIYISQGIYNQGSTFCSFNGVLTFSGIGKNGWPIYRGVAKKAGRTFLVTDCVFDEENGELRFSIRSPKNTEHGIYALLQHGRHWEGPHQGMLRDGTVTQQGGRLSCYVSREKETTLF